MGEIKPEEKSKVSFLLNSEIYPLDAVFKTCYVFIDEFFIHLDKTGEGRIEVGLKKKGEVGNFNLEKARGEFHNELLNILVREKVSERNKKITEYIVGGAITASLRGVASSRLDEGWLRHEQHQKENEEPDKAVKPLRAELEKLDLESTEGKKVKSKLIK